LWEWLREPVHTTLCVDCGVDALALREWYIVHDELWAMAWVGRIKPWHVPSQQILCVGCLERRIGRQLTADDFPDDVPLNRLPENSARLRDRR
jgi:hypothetical protein